MSFWQAVTWETARASGLVAYLLFTGSVAVGLALTQHWQSARWPRLINAEMHNFLALAGLVFTALHVLAVAVDPFTHFGLGAVLLPFVSTYRPLWMGLGTTGLYLGLAILVSTWLRPRIGYTWWRRIHVLTLVGYALVTLHGLGTGSDTRTWYGLLIYGGSVTLIGVLLLNRLLVPATERGKSHPVVAAFAGLGLLALALWALLGPLQPNWSALAGGSRPATASVGSTQSSNVTQAATGDPFKSGFSDTVTGTLSQTNPDASGNVTLTLHMTLNTIAGGVVQVQVQAQQLNDGSLSVGTGTVTLGTSTKPDLYSGTLGSLEGDRTWRVQAQLSNGGTRLQVNLALRFTGDTTFQGQIDATPTTSSSSLSTIQ